jgi:arylsulfatase A-like enzyme
MKEKSNVLIILTDDLGYGDISCYGQKGYETPNIDYLARSIDDLMAGRYSIRFKL